MRVDHRREEVTATMQPRKITTCFLLQSRIGLVKAVFRQPSSTTDHVRSSSLDIPTQRRIGESLIYSFSRDVQGLSITANSVRDELEPNISDRTTTIPTIKHAIKMSQPRNPTHTVAAPSFPHCLKNSHTQPHTPPPNSPNS